MVRSVILLFLAVSVVMLGQQDGYVGADACGQCHAEQFRRQSRSRHANALRRLEESPIAQTFKDGQLPSWLQWAFGAGAQGITPVGLREGRYFEYRLSYYPSARRLDLTFGHPRSVPAGQAELGIPQDSRTIFQCFNCHSTGVKAGASGPELAEMRPGVTCERCHGPGRLHIAAANGHAPSAETRRAIVDPKHFPARRQIEFCGECHRLPPPGSPSPEPEIEDPVSVRFSPVGLLASRCYTSGQHLTCATCHDPHDDAKLRSDASYTARCTGCHPAASTAAARCPRQTNDKCLSCHMTQTTLGPYLRFTDHRIRVN